MAHPTHPFVGDWYIRREVLASSFEFEVTKADLFTETWAKSSLVFGDKSRHFNPKHLFLTLTKCCEYLIQTRAFSQDRIES